MGIRVWRLIRGLGLLCLLLLLGCSTAALPQGTQVHVSQAISGQTLEVLDPSGQSTANQKVRLLGLDAPDPRQEPWSVEAKERLQALVGGKTVLLESDLEQQDSYGRTLAYVWLDGLLINEQLLEDGQAVAAVRSPNLKYEQRLIRAQEKARLLERGIWSPDRAMRLSPSDFRKQNPS